MTHDSTSQSAPEFELRFVSLIQIGRALAFPCDREGHVDLDHITERAKNNYLFARAMMGREYAWPEVSRAA